MHSIVSTPAQRRPIYYSVTNDGKMMALDKQRRAIQSSSASRILTDMRTKQNIGVSLGATLSDMKSARAVVPSLTLPKLPARGQAKTARPDISLEKEKVDEFPLPPPRKQRQMLTGRSLDRYRPIDYIPSLEATAPVRPPNQPLSRAMFDSTPRYFLLERELLKKEKQEEIDEVAELPKVVHPRFGIKQILKKMASTLEIKKYLNAKVAELDKNVEKKFEQTKIAAIVEEEEKVEDAKKEGKTGGGGEGEGGEGTFTEFRGQSIAATKIQVFLRARWEIQRRVRARKNTRDASLRASGKNKDEVREQRGSTPGQQQKKVAAADAVAGMYGL